MEHISNGAPVVANAWMFFVLCPLDNPKEQFKYILIMYDIFTKWAEAVSLPDKARTIKKTLWLLFVRLFSTPLQIHSDQGRNVEPNIF